MTSLLINRVNFSISEMGATLYFSSNPQSQLLFRTQLKHLKKVFFVNEKFNKWCKEANIPNEDFVYYGFTHTDNAPFNLCIRISLINLGRK